MYNYYFRLRPPMYGTLPDGFSEYESWQPVRKAPEFGNTEHRFHGWASYWQPLTFEQVWKFDLLPASRQEYIEYMFWEDANRTEDFSYLRELLQTDTAILVESAEWGNFMAELALEYKCAGYIIGDYRGVKNDQK